MLVQARRTASPDDDHDTLLASVAPANPVLLPSSLAHLLMDPAAAAVKRAAIRAALAERDLGRLRSLAADEGGFVDQELRQAVWCAPSL
jgi:hypothetical protein